MKNEQIVLDRVLAHLKAQGWERSMEAGSCRTVAFLGAMLILNPDQS